MKDVNLKVLGLTGLLVFALGLVVSAEAQQKRPLATDYWDEFEAQRKSLQRIEISSPGLKGLVPGYLNSRGQVLIDQVESNLTSEFRVESEKWGRYRTRSHFARSCYTLYLFMETDRPKNYAYKLKFNVLPLSKEGQVTIKKSSGAGAVAQGPANILDLEDSYRFNFEPVSGRESVALQSQLNMNLFELAMVNQLAESKRDWLKTGEVELDLTGYDDVVCDLINGNLRFTAQLKYRFQQPLIQRKTFIDPREMEQLVSKVMENAHAYKDGQDIVGFHMVYLADALFEIRRRLSHFEKWELVRLSNLLFVAPTGQLKNDLQLKTLELSQSMDRLEKQESNQALRFTLSSEQ